MKHFIAFVFFPTFLGYAYAHSNILLSSTQLRDESKIEWDSTVNWKIYKLHNFNRVFNIPIDSLRYLKSKPLSDDSIHDFLDRATKIDGGNPIWQGCYLASYETKTGKIQKVIISHYAGFFYCQSKDTYFQITPSLQKDWLEYFSESYVTID